MTSTACAMAGSWDATAVATVASSRLITVSISRVESSSMCSDCRLRVSVVSKPRSGMSPIVYFPTTTISNEPGIIGPPRPPRNPPGPPGPPAAAGAAAGAGVAGAAAGVAGVGGWAVFSGDQQQVAGLGIEGDG